MLKIIFIITKRQRQRPPHPSRPASPEALPHAAFISGKHCSTKRTAKTPTTFRPAPQAQERRPGPAAAAAAAADAGATLHKQYSDCQLY